MSHLFYLTISTLLVVFSTYIYADNSCRKFNNFSVFGLEETAALSGLDGIKVNALIDSGAAITSLDARDIKMHVARNGQREVYYNFVHAISGKTVSTRQSVAKVVYIVTHSGHPKKRPIVNQTIKIGNIEKKVQVSLTSRSNFKHQLLIGRNYLAKTALVDSGRRYLQDDGG